LTGEAAISLSLYKPTLVRSRLASRYYTGPVGHLVAGIADWAELLTRWKWEQLRERLSRRGAARR
jgi:hypothetical protein